MEVDAAIDKFKRLVEKFGVHYRNYIRDGDSKTYSGTLKAAPYGDEEVMKKEYTDLRNDKFSEKCFGGFTKNNNENYN